MASRGPVASRSHEFFGTLCIVVPRYATGYGDVFFRSRMTSPPEEMGYFYPYVPLVGKMIIGYFNVIQA